MLPPGWLPHVPTVTDLPASSWLLIRLRIVSPSSVGLTALKELLRASADDTSLIQPESMDAYVPVPRRKKVQAFSISATHSECCAPSWAATSQVLDVLGRSASIR